VKEDERRVMALLLQERLPLIASVVSTHSLRVKTGNKQIQIDDHRRRGFSMVDNASSAFLISPSTVLRV
jgi:hypothetical protein